MKRFAGLVLLIFGAAVFITGGLCSLILDYRLLRAVYGLWVAIGAAVLFPAVAVIFPFYAGAAYGYWEPLWLMIFSAVGFGVMRLGATWRGVRLMRRSGLRAGTMPPPDSSV